jgi:succinate-acetate transporter protein
LLFFGGTGQFLSGIMEFVRGNTVGRSICLGIFTA